MGYDEFDHFKREEKEKDIANFNIFYYYFSIE